MPLCLVLSLIRVARLPVLSQIVVLYVSLGRATPLVTLVLFLFVTLPVFGVNIDRYTAGVVALTLNTASFNTEVWRSVYQAFPQPQIEAARALTWGATRFPRASILPGIHRLDASGGASGLRIVREAVSYTTWHGGLHDHP